MKPVHRVAGALRSALEEDAGAAKPAGRTGSGVFGRMPPPAPPLPVVRGTPVELPRVRRRRRIAGIVMPVLVAAAGGGSAWLLYATTRSLPIALVCAGVGVVGAVFCHILLRDRIEIA